MKHCLVLCCLCLVGVAAGLVGCGAAPDGPARNSLSGKVTFNGEPVPFGEVNFIPDSAAGNSGPQGSARIVNGVYNTRDEGQGSVGGAMIVSISGRSKDTANEFEDQGILFTNYTQKVELPKVSGAMDFDVPKSAAPQKTK